MYGGCPLIWASKLKTEVALSTMEAEYISLSQDLCNVIPLMGLMKEMKQFGFEAGSAWQVIVLFGTNNMVLVKQRVLSTA